LIYPALPRSVPFKILLKIDFKSVAVTNLARQVS